MLEPYTVKDPFAEADLGLRRCVFCEIEVRETDADAHVASRKHIKYARQAIHSWARLCEEGPNLWRDGITVACHMFECKTCGIKDQW